MGNRRYTDGELYGRLLRQARPYWPHIGVIFVLSLLSAPLALLPPLPLKLAVDSVIGDEPLPRFVAGWLPPSVRNSPSTVLGAIAVGVVVIAAAVSLNTLAIWCLKTYTGEKLILEFRSRLFRHVQTLSLKYHDERGTVDSTYRIQYDTGCVRDIAMDGVAPFLSSSLQLLAMLYVTARIDWQLALIAMTVCPALLVLTRHGRRQLRSRWGEVKRMESNAMSLVQEVLGAVRVVKAFGREDHERQRFEEQSRELVRGRLRVTWIQASFDLLVGLVIAGGTAGVLLVGVNHVRAGTLTLGELLLVMAYLTQLYQPLNSLSKRVAGLQSALASADRAFGILDEDPDVRDRPDARPLTRALGAIAIREVDFGYRENQPVLRDIQVEIPAGTRVGIVGHTGAGKSSLVSLLMRFYDPTRGAILLDGVDLREFRVSDLRRQFAVVLQEPVLFAASIGENIAYARPGASEAEIERATRAANAHAFIQSLPDGYQTQVGERGLQLSGGERQRISLARAFLRDAPILILDEPTSAVDVHTEAEIMDAMQRLMQGRTTFIIAHRLVTLKNCGFILHLDGGRLTQVLKPDDVARQGAGLFAASSAPDPLVQERSNA